MSPSMQIISTFILFLSIWILLLWLKLNSINRILQYENAQTIKLQNLLDQNYMLVELKTLKMILRLLLAFALLMAIVFRSWMIFFIFGPLFHLMLYQWIRWMHKRRIKKIEKQLLPFLYSMQSSIQAGHSLYYSLESAIQFHPKPISQEFLHVLKEYEMGSSFESALINLRNRVLTSEMDIFIQSMVLSQKLGAPLTQFLAGIITVLRHRFEIREKLSSLTAQNKTQSYVACFLPLVFLGVCHFFLPGHLDPLLQTQLGRYVLYGCMASLAIGLIWVIQLSNMEVY